MSGGLKGMSRLPRDTVRARRNATKFASDFVSVLGDGLAVTAGLIVIDLAADKGLEFIAGDLATKIQSPLICDAAGLGIDPGNGLEISGTELVVDLTATPGLEFSAGDLQAKVAAPVAIDATGIHLDYDTNYFALSGTDLSIVNPITADIISSNDITAATFTAVNAIDEFSTDGTLGDNSDTAVPTERAVKTYVAGYQPLDADLISIALLGTAADKMIYTTAVDVWAESAITAAGRAILDDATAAIQCTTLGLGIGDSPTFAGVTLTGLTGILKAAVGVVSGNADLADLNDVTIAAVGDNEVLAYNNATSEWINQTAAEAGLATAAGWVPYAGATGDVNLGAHNLITTGYVDATSFYIGGSKVLHIPGTDNTFVGVSTGGALTSGAANVLIGKFAGNALTSGNNNVVIGQYTGFALTEGNDNTLVGQGAGHRLTTGVKNTCVGVGAGEHLIDTNHNLLFGYRAGYNCIGSDNVAVGAWAGHDLTTGNENMLLGRSAGYILTTGIQNILIGQESNSTGVAVSGSIGIGYQTLITANGQFVIGSINGPITQCYIGEGVVSTSPQDVTFQATGGSGTNIAASDFIIAAGKSTGNADPGDLLFQTSTAGAAGDALQTLSTRVKIDGDGNTFIGDGGVTNYAQFKADGELNLYGTARIIRHLRVGAASWDKGASAPTGGFEGVFSTIDFDNTSDDEAHYTIIVPSRWADTIDIEFAVDWFYDGAGAPGTVEDAGTVCWALEYKAVKAGELVTGAGTTIAKTSAGNHSSDKMVRTVFTTKILAANLEVGDTLGFRLYRDVDGGGDAGDTLAVNARLINTHFHFTQNKLGQAT